MNVDGTKVTAGVEPDLPFATLETLAIRCGPNQHNYQQGMDSPMHPEGQWAHLLFCTNCGDVVEFSLPRMEPAE